MSAQRIGAKRTRQIEATLGEPILRGWSHGGYWLAFIVARPEREDGHLHGAWNVKSHEVEWEDGEPFHYTSCGQLVAAARLSA